MKELSIEEKARAYDEALERAEALIAGETNTSDTLFYLNDIKSIFPELTESEDKKIRKAIIKFLIDVNNGAYTKSELEIASWIAWLEKQGKKLKKVPIWKHWKNGIVGNGDGEQIYLIKTGNIYDISSCLGCECDYIELSELDNLLLEKQGEQQSKLVDFGYNAKDSDLQEVTYFIPNGFHAEMDGNKVVIKQGEQKPAIDFRAEDWCVSKVDGKIHNIYNSEVEQKPQRIISAEAKEALYDKPKWSNDDEQYLLVCKNALRKYQVSDKWDADIISKWLEDKLKQGEQKPAWSEEDELIALSIEHVMNCASLLNIVPEKIDKIRTWLKSLKQRMGGMNNDT